MTKKPTYEELEQRISELEQEAAGHNHAEEALRKIEQEKAAILDSMTEHIVYHDMEHKVLWANKAAAESVDSTPEQLVGHHCFEIWHQRTKPCIGCPVQKAIETGQLQEAEMVTPDGRIWFIRGNPVRDANGTIAGGIETTLEITTQKWFKEALKVSEAQKKAILDASVDRVRLVDTDMRIIWANKTTTRELNITPEDLVGKFCYSVFVGRDSPCPECPTVKSLTSGNMEHAILHQPYLNGIEGETYWGTYTVPIKNESGDIENLIQVTRDITESKKVEEALRESEERLENILASIQTGIVIINSETHTIVDANPSAIKMIGAAKDEIIGHVCHRYICPAEKGRCPVTDLGQKVDSEERILMKANGEEVSIIKTVTPMILRGKKYLLESFIDITEKKYLEAQFQHAQRMESIGTLAGGIAHNFNNILMGIEGYVSLILMDIHPTHPYCHSLEGIEKQVQSGAELTKQLLGFARGGKYEIVAMNLNELIKTQNRMFGRTKKEITVRGKYEENLWIAEVDQGQIEQVLLNLYVNAWQAMPRGGDLYIQTENVTLTKDYVKPFDVDPGRYIKISVTDTGVGMDEETQRRIFEPFFTTREMGKGTGLGLSSVYGIIRNHDGIINVDSIKDQGTTFTIYLPVSDKEMIKQEDLHEEILKGKETVLLVDDEDVIIDVGKGILKTLGYNALIARNGKEALEIVRKAYGEKGIEKKSDTRPGPGAVPCAIDLVILDMIMPSMGGGETYDRMKKLHPSIKVLLSSGYSIDGQATEILKRGCDGFIQKPFNIKQLAKRIREVLDKN